MTKYYYLVSSLPHLSFPGEPPISVETFISECGKWCSPADMGAILSSGRDNYGEDPQGGQLLRACSSFERELRGSLAEFRKQRRASGKTGAPERLKTALEQDNPLLMEKALEKMRWDFLEDKRGLYFFDGNWLILYYLKLQILDRLSRFDKDKGENYFYKICEVVYE
ncbi:MAG: DUF2764 family protein [Candidatus Omnitrophota bacterium]